MDMMHYAGRVFHFLGFGRGGTVFKNTVCGEWLVSGCRVIRSHNHQRLGTRKFLLNVPGMWTLPGREMLRTTIDVRDDEAYLTYQPQEEMFRWSAADEHI